MKIPRVTSKDLTIMLVSAVVGYGVTRLMGRYYPPTSSSVGGANKRPEAEQVAKLNGFGLGIIQAMSVIQYYR